MRTSVLFALVAVALTAVLAAPAPQHSHHNAAQINLKQIQPLIKISPAQTRDWLADLIDAITGSDVVALLKQIDTTLKGLDALVKQAETELEDILVNVSQEAAADIQSVVDEALREAVKIIEPILGQLGKVMPIVSKNGLSTQDISSIISAVLGRSLEDFLNSIKEALVQLEELLNVTSDRLAQIAQSAAQSAADQIQAVIDNTIAQAKVIIKPLLDILGQIFGNNKSVAHQNRDLIADVVEIIEALLGIDIGAIVARIPITVQEVEAALQRAVDAAVALVEAEVPAVAERLNAIVSAAVVRAQEILQRLLDVLAPILGGGRHVPKDIIGDLVEIILGVTLEELVALINETATELDALIQDTLAQIQAVANEISVEVGQAVQEIVAQAARDIQAAVQPLLELLAPLLPPPSKAVARQHRDLISDIVEIIESLLGINIASIVAQIPITIQGVEDALLRAAEAVVALVETEAPAVAQELAAILSAAAAKAQEILQPLLDVLAPVLGGGRHVPKDIIGDLVEIILGVTLEELQALINETATNLDALIHQTLEQVQEVANRVSAEVGQAVQVILEDARSNIGAAVDPLLELLAPLLPPPSGKVAIRKMNKDLIEDAIQIIGALLGVDVKAIFEQIPVTIAGVESELAEAVNKLVALLEATDATVQQRLEAVINQAVAQAEKIVEPLLDLIAPLIPSGKTIAILPKDLLDDLLQIILGVTLEELVTLVNTTVTDLENLLAETVAEVQRIASEVSAELVAEVSAIVDETYAGIQNELKPLLELLAPLLPPPTKAVARQHRDLISDVVEIIEALLGIDIAAIVKQIPITVQGVEDALLRAVEALVALVETEAPAVAEELNAIATVAIARAKEILRPLYELLAPILGGGRHVPKDIIGDLVEIILGVTLEELQALINETATNLDALIHQTLEQVQELANRVSAEVGQAVQVILENALVDVDAAVDPLLELLAPLLPPPSGKVSIRKMNKDLIEDAIQIIGALLGLDIKAIVEQIPVTIAGVESELTNAANALVALLEATDATVQQRLEALINQAVARAQEIVKPLLDLLAPLIPSGKALAILPKDLLDDLLQIILGVTLEELVTLVQNTVTELDQLLVETVAEIQRLALEVSADLAAEVAAIVDAAVAGIEQNVAPLLELLAPILPPTTKAIIRQHRDLIADIVEIIESLLGVDIGAIVAQIPITVQEVEAALLRAAEAVVALVETEAPAVAQELAAIFSAAAAKAQEILRPLYELLAPILGGGRHVPKDIIGDLVEIILGVTLEELQALINETATNLDALIHQTLEQVQEVANRVSAEVGQAVQVILETARTDLNAAVKPLLELLAPLLPPPSKAVVRDPIQDLIQIISELLGIDVAAILTQAEITQAEIVAILEQASVELEAILAAGDAELAERLDAIINGALAEGQDILKPLLEVLAPIVGGGNGLKKLNKDIIGDLVEALLGITLKELIELTTTTLINLEALFNRTLDEIAQVAAEVSADVDAQVQAVLQLVEQKIAAALQPLIDLLAPLLPGGGSKIAAHHHQQKDLISDLIDLIGQAIGVDLGPIVEQARLTAQGVAAAITLADSQLNALLEGSDLLERVEAISAAAEAEGRAILQPLVDVVQQTISNGALPITLDELVALVESTVRDLEALALRTVGQIQEEVLGGAGADLVPEVRRILRELILEINSQVGDLLEVLEPLRPTPAPRMRLISRQNLRIKA